MALRLIGRENFGSYFVAAMTPSKHQLPLLPRPILFALTFLCISVVQTWAHRRRTRTQCPSVLENGLGLQRPKKREPLGDRRSKGRYDHGYSSDDN
jgi:hypothetical protein